MLGKDTKISRKCPHHGLPKWMQVQNFKNGLGGSTRTVINATAGGALLSKTKDAAYELLENNNQWPSKRNMQKRPVGVYEIDAITTLTAQVAYLTKQLWNSQIWLFNLFTLPPKMCDFGRGNHPRDLIASNTAMISSWHIILSILEL